MSNNISPIEVPFEIPERCKILVIGEAPGEEEELNLRPFIGPAGQRLRNTFLNCGFPDSEVGYCNLSKYRPNYNKFYFLYNSEELKRGMQEVRDTIERVRPNVIVPLGNEPLEFCTGKKGKGNTISTWRGNIIPYQHDPSIKCIPTFHPSYIERNQENLPAFALDIARIISDSEFADFRYTKREYHINPTGLELERWTSELCRARLLAVDIESTEETHDIICVGFAPSANTAVTIFFDSIEGRKAIGRILESDAAKVFHFGIFDTLMLRRAGYNVNNVRYDTYIAQRVYSAEQPDSLAYLASIYTREPYYKAEGRSEIPNDTKVWSTRTDRNKLGIYNCKDVCVTYEVHEKLLENITKDNLLHVYENGMEQQEMAIHISESGVLIDEERRHLFERALLYQWNKKQAALNFLAGEVVNVNSSTAIPKLLYKKLGLPERKVQVKGEWRVTTNEDAIVKTLAYIKGEKDKLTRKDAIQRWEQKEAICKLIVQIRGIRKLLSTYIRTEDKKHLLYSELDLRARSTYKVAGTETLRYSAEQYVDGTGVNGQTFPREGISIPDDLDKSEESSILATLLLQLKEEEQFNEEAA